MNVFFDVVIALLFGLCSGVVTGIIPGIHVNLVSVVVVSLSPFLLTFTTPLGLGVYIISLSITHSFCDGIPSIYLGAPDESTVLGVLPGHRMLREGRGHIAVMLLTFGSYMALLVGLVFVPLFLVGMQMMQDVVSVYVGFVLVLLVVFLIFREGGKWFFALCVFLLSGLLGLVVFHIEGLSQPLFPLLSGLFGVSLLIGSLAENTVIPPQNSDTSVRLGLIKGGKAIAGATGMGYAAAFLPGFGSSQAAIIATKVVGDIGDDGFMILIGGINTANTLLSVVAIYAIDKARNGAIVAVDLLMGGVGFSEMLLFLCVALIVGSIATVITLRLSRVFSRFIVRMHYPTLVRAIILFIILLTFLFDGFTGLIILGTATSIGLLCSRWEIGKNHLLGCLLLPVILYFI